jgi:hypothetical protein
MSSRQRTRSLLAWTQVLILSYLGFEISSPLQKLDTPELYDAYILRRTVSTAAVAFLVTCNDRATDPLESDIAAALGELKPRVLPTKAIPWTAFRHLGSGDGRDSAKYLSDVRDYSFSNAFAAFGIPKITRDGTVLLRVQPENETDSYVPQSLAIVEPSTLESSWSANAIICACHIGYSGWSRKI